MPISRALIHETKIEKFKEYLKYKGWTIRETKNCWEAIRATKENNPAIVLYQRSGTNNLTIGWNMMHVMPMVYEFLNNNPCAECVEARVK
jgi:hypothetical protein